MAYSPQGTSTGWTGQEPVRPGVDPVAPPATGDASRPATAAWTTAGTSPAGRAFAAKHSDLIFGGLTSFETPERVVSLKLLAREEYGREIRVFGRCHVVCRESDAEAEEYYDDVHRRRADVEGARNVTSISIVQSQSTDWESAEMRRLIEGCVAGFWAVPIVGSPETVIKKLCRIKDRLGIGALLLEAQAGQMSHQTTMRSIELLGREVIPALKEL